MSNLATLLFIALVFYAVPLFLSFLPRIWIRIYFAVALVLILVLGYQTYALMQVEGDCRAGCGFAIGLMVATFLMVTGGTLLAMLSIAGFRKWRAMLARKRVQTHEAA